MCMDGVEGGSWGFFAAGAAFIVVGAVMLFVGGRNYLRREKEKRAEQEAQAQIIRETQPAKEKKTMSIADRARLAEGLDDAEETETQADTERRIRTSTEVLIDKIKASQNQDLRRFLRFFLRLREEEPGACKE